MRNYLLTPEAKERLELSINHWKRMSNPDNDLKEIPGSENCSLCKAYLNDSLRVCRLCPIVLSGHHARCHNSNDDPKGNPYGNAADQWPDMDVEDSKPNYEFYAAAQKMVEFLERVLDHGVEESANDHE